MWKSVNRRFKTAIYEQFARIGKAISNPSRLELLDLFARVHGPWKRWPRKPPGSPTHPST